MRCGLCNKEANLEQISNVTTMTDGTDEWVVHVDCYAKESQKCFDEVIKKLRARKNR